jgi:hypothetical protein
MTAIGTLCLRILRLTIAITLTTILYLSSSVRAIVLATTAGLFLSVVTAKSATEDGARLVEEATETTLILVLFTGRRGHLVASVLLNHARDGTSSTLQDGVGRSASDLVLKGLRAASVQLAHLKLARAAVAMASVVDTFLVVLAVLNTLTGQLAAVLLSLLVTHLVPPVLDTFIGAATAFLDLSVSKVTLSGVVHDTVDDVVEESLHIDTLIINGIHELRNNPLNYSGSIASSDLVQDVREVILGKHRVSGVRGAVIVEDDVLLVLTACNNLIRTSLQLVSDLLNERNDERSNDGEDEDRELLLKLLNDLGKHRDALHGARDALHDVIVELNSRHDLLKDILDVLGEFLGVTGRHTGVLHLGSGGIVLELINSVALVLISKNAIRDLIQKITEHAGVRLSTLLKSTFKLLNLVLGQLIGNFTSD